VKIFVVLLCFLGFQQHTLLPTSLYLPQLLTPVSADGLLADLATSTYHRLFPAEDLLLDDNFESRTLNIVEISEMRARDIKRHLARRHGYDADELSRMIDKKELINALSFEEHKVYLQEVDRRKWIRFKTSVIYTAGAIGVVMFWPLVVHALKVGMVNLEVYSDRRKYELKRCHEFKTVKGYFGMFLLFCLDLLSFWLSASVLLSWVVRRSKWFFPIPNIPIRPAQLLTSAINPSGDAGALGAYGINVGPMLISFLLRFLKGKVELFIGRAMAQALKRQKKKEKEEIKRAKKEAKEIEKMARKEARRLAKIAEEERRARQENIGGGNNAKDDLYSDDDDDDDQSYGDNSYNGMTASNVTRNAIPTTTFDTIHVDDDDLEPVDVGGFSSSNFDDLD